MPLPYDGWNRLQQIPELRKKQVLKMDGWKDGWTEKYLLIGLKGL